MEYPVRLFSKYLGYIDTIDSMYGILKIEVPSLGQLTELSKSTLDFDHDRILARNVLGHKTRNFAAAAPSVSIQFNRNERYRILLVLSCASVKPILK